MRLGQYLIFAACSCVLAVVSVVLWPINAVTMLLLHVGAAPWTLSGELSPASGWGGLRPVIWMSAAWPLTLAPLHWVSSRWFGRTGWVYAVLLLVVNVLLAFLVLVLNDNS